MAPELATALSAYAIATDGNLAEGVWSIGGPLPADELVGALLGTGQGLSYSHNAYEGDASIGTEMQIFLKPLSDPIGQELTVSRT